MKEKERLIMRSTLLIIMLMLLTSCSMRKDLEDPILLKLENDLIISSIEIKEYEKLSGGRAFFMEP